MAFYNVATRAEAGRAASGRSEEGIAEMRRSISDPMAAEALATTLMLAAALPKTLQAWGFCSRSWRDRRFAMPRCWSEGDSNQRSAPSRTPVPPQNLIPQEFIGGFEGLQRSPVLRSDRDERKQSWSAGANLEPVPRWFWKRSHSAIKLLCWSAAELVARACVVLIGCFGSCCRAGGRNGVKA